MAFLTNPIRLNELPAEQSYDLIPPGEYDTLIESAEVKATKAGNGQYIRLRLKVTGPTHAGRVVFGNITLQNQNETAENIGRQQLGQVMRAGGLDQLSDTDQLVGINVRVKLAVSRSEQYGDQNEVKSFKPVSGAPAPAASKPFSAPAPAPAPAPAAGGAAPPWVKR